MRSPYKRNAELRVTQSFLSIAHDIIWAKHDSWCKIKYHGRFSCLTVERGFDVAVSTTQAARGQVWKQIFSKRAHGSALILCTPRSTQISGEDDFRMVNSYHDPIYRLVIGVPHPLIHTKTLSILPNPLILAFFQIPPSNIWLEHSDVRPLEKANSYMCTKCVCTLCTLVVSENIIII